MHPPGQGAAAVRRRLQAPTWVRTACWEVRRAPEGDKNGRPRRKSGNFEGRVRGCEGTSQGRRRRVAAAGAAGAGRPLGPGAARAQRGRSAGAAAVGGVARGRARGRARARAIPARPPRPPAAPRDDAAATPPTVADREGRAGRARAEGAPSRSRARLRSGAGCRHSRGFGRRAGKFDGHPRGAKTAAPAGSPEPSRDR